MFEHGRADVPGARIDGDGFTRDAGLKESLRHAVRRPRLLRSWLQHETDLHRDDRQPQRVDARRVRWQDEAQHRALRLVADRHAAFFAVPAREHVERQPSRERRQDPPHLRQHERVLLHVRAAHALWKPRARRLRPRELLGRLRSVAHRERGVHVELAGGADARDQIVDRDLAQGLARALRLAHVAPDQAAVRAADARDRLSRREVHDVVHFEARVRLAPAEDRYLKHQ